MPSPDKAIALVALVGPTAVGKTDLAVKLAERLNGEIVSADSRLLYRGMDIGTAKPSIALRSRIAHHLIDVAAPDETWSLARFQAAAAAAIVDVAARGKLPLLVGGTGQYLRAIVEGWAPPALPPQPALRAALEAWAETLGAAGLHQRLARLDPAAAANIDARNLRRTLRALEVTLASGRRFSAQRGQRRSPYRLLQIGLRRPRPELYARIDQRIEAMLAEGWLAEVQALLDKGYRPDLPSMSAIGYAQLSAHLHGALSLEEAVTDIKRRTRLFVRRQAAWFRPADPQIQWFEAAEAPLAAIEATIRAFLAAKD